MNGSTWQSPGLYLVPDHFNGLRTNIQHLFALQGDMSASAILYLNLQFIFCYERISDSEVWEDVGFFQRCLNQSLTTLLFRGESGIHELSFSSQFVF